MRNKLKIYLILTLLSLIGCAAPTKFVISGYDSKGVDFGKIKNSTISIYVSKPVITYVKSFLPEDEKIETLNLIKKSFNKIIPTIKIEVDSINLPSFYDGGPLNLEYPKENEFFLRMHNSDYIFIITNMDDNFNQRTSSGILMPVPNSPRIKEYQQMKVGFTTTMKLSVSLLSVKEQKDILNYEVTQVGNANLKEVILTSIKYINDEGKCFEYLK